MISFRSLRLALVFLVPSVFGIAMSAGAQTRDHAPTTRGRSGSTHGMFSVQFPPDSRAGYANDGSLHVAPEMKYRGQNAVWMPFSASAYTAATSPFASVFERGTVDPVAIFLGAIVPRDPDANELFADIPPAGAANRSDGSEHTSGRTSSLQSAPETSSMLLFGGGLIGVLVLRQRRPRRA